MLVKRPKKKKKPVATFPGSKAPPRHIVNIIVKPRHDDRVRVFLFAGCCQQLYALRKQTNRKSLNRRKTGLHRKFYQLAGWLHWPRIPRKGNIGVKFNFDLVSSHWRQVRAGLCSSLIFSAHKLGDNVVGKNELQGTSVSVGDSDIG